MRREVRAVSWRRCGTTVTNWYAAKMKPPTTVVVEISANGICNSAGIHTSRAFRMMRRCHE
jgi:hypothetical protein